MSAKAISTKPKVTFTTFIQLPLLGTVLSHWGKRAKRVKGNAKAMAKPSMPMTGPTMLEVTTCTSRKPMMGPVQEKLTSTNVNAIKKMLKMPVVLLALLSTAVFHFDGKVISKPPTKEIPKMSSIRKNRILNTALVARSLRADAPKIAVMTNPRVT